MPGDDDSGTAKPAACDAQHQADTWAKHQADAGRIVNRPAIEAWSQYVEQHGIPLAEFRQF
jgi:post-segregation antitoxin (ccd killing protein)